MEIDNLMKKPYGVLGVMGMRGFGKSYFAARLKFPKHVEHVYYIDVVGAFRKELPQLDYIEFDRLYPKEIIERALEKSAKEKTRELILDVSNLRRSDLVSAVNYICEYLMYKARPCALVVDEAGDVLEQEHVFYAEDLERAVRIGRNKNILFVVLITQRPQKINKHAFTLSDQYAVFKFVHNLDIEAVRLILGYKADEFAGIAAKLKSQDVGEYMLTDGLNVKYNTRDGNGWNETKRDSGGSDEPGAGSGGPVGGRRAEPEGNNEPAARIQRDAEAQPAKDGSAAAAGEPAGSDRASGSGSTAGRAGGTGRNKRAHTYTSEQARAASRKYWADVRAGKRPNARWANKPKKA